MSSLSKSLCVLPRGFISVMDPTTRTIFPCIRMTVTIASTFYSCHVEPHLIPDEYFDDLGLAYRAELRELYQLGCRKPYISFLLLFKDPVLMNLIQETSRLMTPLSAIFAMKA